MWRAACRPPSPSPSADEALGEALATALGYRNLRIYWSGDTIGVQLGGAVKNVLAIAAGIVHGAGSAPARMPPW
jgi:glycerol-3-phosphate dehydrogenase